MSDRLREAAQPFVRTLNEWEAVTNVRDGTFVFGLFQPGPSRTKTIYDIYVRHLRALRAALDAPENDQTIRAREQAGGLDHWAAVLEAHEPKGAAAGIVMLREAAKTLRALAGTVEV